MILSLLFLILGIVCYSISQLQQHGKLKWAGKPFSFWGPHSDKRKFKYSDTGEKSPAFPLSTTLLVFLTDGYHLSQFMFLNFLSLSVTFALGFNWWLLLGVWSLIHLCHWGVYRLLQK